MHRLTETINNFSSKQLTFYVSTNKQSNNQNSIFFFAKKDTESLNKPPAKAIKKKC